MIQNVLPFLLFSLLLYIVSMADVFSLKISKEQRIFLVYLSLFLLVVFAGCRWSSDEVGYDRPIFDYGSYKNVFYDSPPFLRFFPEYKDASFEVRIMEIGYVFYSSFMRFIIGDSYNFYLLVTNFFIIWLFYHSIKNNHLYVSCIFFLFFFYASRLYLQYNFILLRQAIAMGIIWYSFRYLLDGKSVKFLCFVLIASLFHVTALMSFLSFLFLKKNRNRELLLLIGFLFILNLFQVTKYIMLSSMDIFFKLVGDHRLGNYISEGGSDYRPLNLLNFVEIIPFFYVVKKYGDELRKTTAGLFYCNMFYCYLFLIVLTMNFGFLSRLSQYFMFSYIYILGYYYNEIDVGRRRIFYFGLGFYLLIYAIRFIFINFYSVSYSNFLLK